MAEYKAIPGFPGYKVSQGGTVVGPDGNRLSPRKDDDGYMRVDIRKNGKRFTKFVHTLVNAAWNGGTVGDKKGERSGEVGHGNDKRKDNRAANLKSTTRKENMAKANKKRAKK